MKWQEFTESSKEYPEKILESSIAGFEKATKGLVQMTITSAGDIDFITSHLENDFQFIVYLRSEYVKKYRLKLLTMGYNVELTPIFLSLEETIFEHIFQRPMKHRELLIIKSEEELKGMLEQIFTSSRFVEIVSGVMKIARRNQESKGV